MENKDFTLPAYENPEIRRYIKYAEITVIVILSITLFVLLGKAIVCYGIAHDVLLYCIWGEFALAILLCVLANKFKWLVVPALIAVAMFFYILYLPGFESSYRFEKTDDGTKFVYQTFPFKPVTVFSGKDIDVIDIVGWFDHYSPANVVSHPITMFRVVGDEGRVTLYSVYYKSYRRRKFVENADKVEIESRTYNDREYQVLKVWSGDSVRVQDIRGNDPDVKGYDPIKIIPDSNYD